MKYVVAFGSLFAVGALASGAGALGLLGSDTMEVLTNSILPGDASHDCGAATLTYLGTGSGNGENALVSGAQQIAPMSRPLKCAVQTANPSFKQHTVALDAIVILESRREGTLGVVGSANDAPPVTDPSLKTCLGVKFSTGAPFDRIRMVFSGGTGTAATADGSAAQCNTTNRKSILNNWQNFTSSTCARSGNPIRHAFRRDDRSGTTDTFKNLVGVSGFCNGTAGGTPTAPAPYTDNDPVRRACDPNEQVCSPNNDLGVVLPIAVPATNPFPGGNTPPDTQADRQARWSNGEFHRLHQSKTIATQPAPVTPCRRVDSTEQIGCLVAVSPYSTGYAGLEATKVSGATYLKVGNVVPREDTIRSFAYPITRRLLVNNLIGDAAVSGDQAKLQACFLDAAYRDPKVTAAGFVTIPAPETPTVCAP